ncbi:hypothetical protein ACVKXF_001056 [Curtobacterium sp. PvP017]
MLIGDGVTTTQDLRQGDVVSLAWIPSVVDGSPASHPCPEGVVIVSQTCDVVQDSKTVCLVAPIVPAENAVVSRARKGQAPLKLYMPEHDGTPVQIADLDYIAAVPKSSLIGTTLTARRGADEQSKPARDIAHRLGRVFTRFPFPDEVYPAFAKLRSRAQKTAGGAGWFGQVLDYVDDLRVTADQWPAPERNLILRVVVEERYLIPVEDADPTWAWETALVVGRKDGELLPRLSLDRTSELLVRNLQSLDADPTTTDTTTILRLWEQWVTNFQASDLTPVSPHVATFTAELVSDVELTYADWKTSESLDLEVLSDSRVGS